MAALIRCTCTSKMVYVRSSASNKHNKEIFNKEDLEDWNVCDICVDKLRNKGKKVDYRLLKSLRLGDDAIVLHCTTPNKHPNTFGRVICRQCCGK